MIFEKQNRFISSYQIWLSNKKTMRILIQILFLIPTLSHKIKQTLVCVFDTGYKILLDIEFDTWAVKFLTRFILIIQM